MKYKAARRRYQKRYITIRFGLVEIATSLLILALLGIAAFAPKVYSNEPAISPESDAPQFFLEFVYQESPELLSVKGERDSEPTKEQVVEYMRQKFGDAFDMAYAVARVEGWPHHEGQGWDRHFCWHKVVNGENKGEYSVGIFQINIIEGCNGEGDKVHWKNIPGNTLEDKIDWLSNPYNNIDYAYQLHKSWGGFGPWTGYTSGNYKKYL